MSTKKTMVLIKLIMILIIIAITKAVTTLTNLDSKLLSYLYHHQKIVLTTFSFIPISDPIIIIM